MPNRTKKKGKKEKKKGAITDANTGWKGDLNGEESCEWQHKECLCLRSKTPQMCWVLSLPCQNNWKILPSIFGCWNLKKLLITNLLYCQRLQNCTSMMKLLYFQFLFTIFDTAIFRTSAQCQNKMKGIQLHFWRASPFSVAPVKNPTHGWDTPVPLNHSIW